LSDAERRIPHPLGGSTMGNWAQTLLRYSGKSTDWRRVLRITALVFAGSPFRAYERLRWHRAVSRIAIREPVFICGHWQSGHTLAQLLLSSDPRFATLRLKHAVQPAACLSMQPVLRWFLAHRIPERRLVDEMPNHLEAPQGDDFALGSLTGISFYYAWYFPRNADEVFRRFVLMENLSPGALRNWSRHYRQLLRKLLWESGCDRVVVRNACNTARMTQILSEFPDARFVVCHRHPYEVFAASLERWEALTRAFSLCRAALSPDELESLTLSWYEQLMQRYSTDRSQIPADRIFEAPYDDLRCRPIELMRNLYDDFGWDGFDAAKPHMEFAHRSGPWKLAGQSVINERQRTLVDQRWGFAFDLWNYHHGHAHQE